MDQSGLNLIELELSLNTLIDRAGIPQRAGCIYLQSAETSPFALVERVDPIETLEMNGQVGVTAPLKQNLNKPQDLEEKQHHA